LNETNHLTMDSDKATERDLDAFDRIATLLAEQGRLA
jgi:hypothetical protein